VGNYLKSLAAGLLALGVLVVPAGIVIVLLLAGCSGMTDEQVRAARVACKANGGNPVPMAHLWGAIKEVRCL
jgi:hypothetical protein